MRERCAVIGAGGQARVVLSLLSSCHGDEYQPQFVIDLQPSGKAESILGCPVLQSQREPVDQLRTTGIETLFLALGDSSARQSWFETFRSQGFQLPNLIADSAYIDANATLGIANVIARNVHVGPCASIGNNNILNTGANIEHESVVGDHCHIAPAVTVCGRVTIGNGCLVGAGSTIIPHRRVADRVVVGAGAVVVADILHPGGTYVGVPARLIGP